MDNRLCSCSVLHAQIRRIQQRDGFKGKKQAKNNYDELSEREYVEVLINDGLSKKDAIKTVCKERKLKKDVVYKQVLDL